jgi:signal transduction histidine kinase
LGVVASYNGNDLKAIEYEEIGLKYALETKDMLSVFYAYQSIGQYSLALDNIKAADKNLKSAYKVASTIGDTTLIMEIFIDFSKFHQSKKNYKKAIDYAKKAETLLAKIGTKNFYTKAVNLQLAESYADIKNYEAAYEYLDKHRIINDTLVSKDNRQLSANMEALYRTNEKETENKKLRIQQAKNEVTIQKRTLLGIVLTLGLVLLLSIAAWLFYNNRKKQSYNRELEKQVRQRTSELQKANNDLEQANYELRTFNYIASHDIKEPIRVIGNYAGLAFRKLPQDLKESLGEYFDTIKRSTAQLYTLIEDFARYTTMSKNETIETKAVNLNSLSLSVVDNLQESIEKYNGQVLIADLPIIPSSNSLLFTTLKNLIENGLKYNKSDKPTVNINYRKTISHHEIIVSDNGIGIEEQYHEKIFEMFKRLHNRAEYDGSGIGLAIVKLSVDKLGGTVELESEEGKGSRFVIQLPI